MITARPILFSAPMICALLEGRKTQTRRMAKFVPEPPDLSNVVDPNPRHAEPYLDCYCGGERTPVNPRGMTPWWCWWTRDDRPCEQFRVPYGAAGDLLWVRETWAVGKCADGLKPSELSRGCWLRENGGLWLEGVTPRTPISPRGVSRSSIHMPRWASRLTLEITGVRVQRLQDISEEDAIAEGVTRIRDGCHVIRGFDYDLSGLCHTNPVTPFAKLWSHINGPGKLIDGEWMSAWDLNPWVIALTFAVHKINVDAFLAQRAAAMEDA